MLKRKMWQWFGIACAVAVVFACVGVAWPQTVYLRTPSDEPIVGAYVAFYYSTERFNLVDSTTRGRPGHVVQSDAEGRVQIPLRLMVKGPLDSRTRANIHLIYAPAQHNAFPSGLAGSSKAGVAQVDAANHRLIMHDVSDDPERWEWSLERLYSAIRFELWPPRVGSERSPYSAAATRAELDELIAALARECDAFHARYGGRIRDAANAETWGRYLERRWQTRAEELRSELASIQ